MYISTDTSFISTEKWKAVFVSFSSNTRMCLMVQKDSLVDVSMSNVLCRDLLHCWGWISSPMHYFRKNIQPADLKGLHTAGRKHAAKPE